MGWFDSQIHERQRADDRRMAEAFASLSEALTGSGGSAAASRASADAVGDILAHFGEREGAVPADALSFVDALEALTRPRGIMYREVALTPGWSREATGAILARRLDGTAVALLPTARGYAYRDHVTGRTVGVGRDDTAGLSERALLFYRPLPARPLTRRDVHAFVLRSMGLRDAVLVALAAATMAALGLVLPAATDYAFGPVLEGGRGDARTLVPLAVLLVSVALARVVVSGVRSLLLGRVGTTCAVQLTAALMMRVLQLPVAFFREHPAGDVASRVLSAPAMVKTMLETVLSLGLTLVFSLVYVVQILVVAHDLAVPTLVVVTVNVVVCAAVAWWQAQLVAERLSARARRTGWEFALVGAIQKIRLAGAERRAFATWADRYADEVRSTYTSYLGRVIPQATGLLGLLVLYGVALESGVDPAAFMAFSAAYAMVDAGVAALGDAAVTGFVATPYLGLLDDVLACQPETGERRQPVGRLTGGIELDHVTFSYGDGLPPVIDDLSVKIRPGEYVGVVGRSGCGKSTLLRLLLGFAEPRTGAIYYDGRDLSTLDVRGLRRNVGVVLQDGRLFQGDIYSNIVVSAPWLSMDEAWEAAELAGIADDIRAMPMGMQTQVGEGTGGISGGQRQRIMIARAIVTKPRILMFDEATSALDNVTQRMVSESLDGLHCTRIVIAHRLSTVRRCDRILVLDGGRVAESGTYEELMELDGLFAELMRRQQL